MMETNKQSKVERNLFFIALLPPQNVRDYANQIKGHFATIYHSKAALKSPPHITLQPPFFWDIHKLNSLETALVNFAEHHSAIDIKLENFAAFKPRVIYIDVHKTPKLLSIQRGLSLYLESSLEIVDKKEKKRDFNPHVTVGFKDLSKTNFYRAWDEFKDKKIAFNFTVNQLTLLRHDGKKWQIQKEFNFSD